jgi:hypothetical protein
MQSLVLGAAAEIEDSLKQLSKAQLIRRARRFRIARLDDASSSVRWTLRLLAQRHHALTTEIGAIDRAIAPLLAMHAAELLAIRGVGPDVAGALLVVAGDNPHHLRSEACFAALCG